MSEGFAKASASGAASPIPLDASPMRTMRWGVRGVLWGLALLALGGCAAGSRAPSPDDAVDEEAKRPPAK